MKTQSALGTLARSTQILTNVLRKHAARRVDAINNIRPCLSPFARFLTKSVGRNAIGLHEVQARLQPQLLGQGQIRISVLDFGSVVTDADKIQARSTRGSHLLGGPDSGDKKTSNLTVGGGARRRFAHPLFPSLLATSPPF